MQPAENVSLKNHSTMRLGGMARYMLDIHSAAEIAPAVTWAEQNNLPIIMIGSGSNIIWTDSGYSGLVLVNKIPGYEMQLSGDQAFLTVGGGENWDSVVERTVAEGFSGIEQLSLIPGTTGATPVQNVGAYGREIAEVLVSVQAYDKTAKQMINIPKIDCGFAYRTSRFKTTDKGRFFITSITLSLTQNPPLPPFYAALQRYLDENKITEHTPQTIRDAVIAIRSSKLPDPAKVANCGSFFGNPIISMTQLRQLLERFPNIVYWEVGDNQAKVSAAWLLEYLGLKGYHEPNTGMAIWDKQALVLVNEKAPNTVSLLAFRDAILAAVQKKFGITLEQEPELLP
jgi:UDP-N-acetylmuramate dehydrogenase